jgi:futalosine hydrolase
MKLLVVAAWDPELERFRELTSAAAPPLSSLSIVTEAVGIGPIDAAIGVTRCVEVVRPDALVFLGTGGAAPRAGLRVGDVVAASSVRLVDAAAVEGRAALLPPYAEAIATDAALHQRLVDEGARACVVGNTLSVTTEDALASTLGGAYEVEHLEAYAVARACGAACPCAIVLGVANMVGSRGRDEWRENHVRASSAAAEIAARAFLRTSTTQRSPA